MTKCRACLATDSEMFPIDDEFVHNYNTLTNLDVKTTDSLCQFICETCLQSVKFFMEFREKCILSEASLRSNCEEIKHEDVNIKTEYEADYLDDSYLESLDFSDSTNINIKGEHNDEDVFSEVKIKIKQKKGTCVKDEAKEPQSNQLSCGLCSKEFMDKNALSVHFEEHKTNLKCQICCKTFIEWPILLSHRLIHLPPGQKCCHLCLRRFTSMQNYEFHFRKNHFNQKNYRIHCSLCINSYETPRKLKKHMYSTHSNTTYVCDICSKVCLTKHTLRMHLISHSDKKRYFCDVCDFSCKYSSGLKDHKIRKHVAGKIYCDTCKRPFGSQQDCDMHKCRASAPKICPVCGIQITRSMRLTRHMESHKEVGTFKCSRCPKTYRTRCALLAHNDKHDNNPRRHCEFCPAKFFHASSLIKHRRTHTGQKPYVCQICHRGFTGNHNLKVHMKVHGIYNLIIKKTKTDQAPDEA